MTRRRGVRLVLALLPVIVVAAVAARLIEPAARPGLATKNSDAPFGPFAGYVLIGGATSIGASFTVPRILSGSPFGIAGTWIGAQGPGPPRRFLQIGVTEVRDEPRGARRALDAYFAFWSDVRHGFRPAILFPVRPADTIRASLALADGRWTLAIADASTGQSRRFSTMQEAEGRFDQLEWEQESPGTEDHHAPYPRLAPPRFSDLTAGSSAPPVARLYSQWMSVNNENLAPTPVRGRSFTLVRAPSVSSAGMRYLRLSAAAGSGLERFEDERVLWRATTPVAQILAASARFAAATRSSLRELAAAPWPSGVRTLLAAAARGEEAVIVDAVPPPRLTPASFAAWNVRLTRALERAAPAAAALRLALGLPALGPAYRR